MTHATPSLRAAAPVWRMALAAVSALGLTGLCSCTNGEMPEQGQIEEGRFLGTATVCGGSATDPIRRSLVLRASLDDGCAGLRLGDAGGTWDEVDEHFAALCLDATSVEPDTAWVDHSEQSKLYLLSTERVGSFNDWAPIPTSALFEFHRPNYGHPDLLLGTMTFDNGACWIYAALKSGQTVEGG